jgi:predicted HAD superfamily Cof-like phosphohydrolase
MMMMKKFEEFASAAGDTVPSSPRVMTLNQIEFTSKMVLDELLELYATVVDPEEAKKIMKRQLDNAKNVEKENEPAVESQVDAFVDIMYYLGHQSAIAGFPLDEVLDEVHDANMRKRDPTTKKFIRRPEDQKIIKPEGWIGPCIQNALMKAQIKKMNESDQKAQVCDHFVAL